MTPSVEFSDKSFSAQGHRRALSETHEEQTHAVTLGVPGTHVVSVKLSGHKDCRTCGVASIVSRRCAEVQGTAGAFLAQLQATVSYQIFCEDVRCVNLNV